MNITEYVREDFDAALYIGRMSIKSGHKIVNANEALYKYIGNNSVRSITNIIHPEDVDDFMEAVGKLETEPQHMFIRILCFNSTYRVMYAVLSLNGVILDGFKSYDVKCYEIKRSFERLDHYAELVKKYRTIMSYSDKFYFDYDCETGEFSLFNYLNGMYDNLVKKRPLSDIKADVNNMKNLDSSAIAKFEVFCDSLENRNENIDAEIDGAVLGIDDRILRLYGGHIISRISKELIVGTVNMYEKKDGSYVEKYYLSPAAIDRSTGVFNKRAIEELSRNVLAENRGSVYFAIFDIDDFKTFNDTYGHMAGDKIIEALAVIARDVVGNRGYVGRFGGDEFIVVTNKVENDTDFIYMLKTIRKNLVWHFRNQFDGKGISVSIGISVAPRNATVYEEVFELADKALYVAKEKGKDRFIFYTPGNEGIVNNDNSVIEPKSRMSDDKYHITQKIFSIFSNLFNDNSTLPKSLSELCKYYDVDYALIYSVKGKYPIHTNDDIVVRPPQLTQKMIKDIEALVDEYGFFSCNKIINIIDEHNDLYLYFKKIGAIGFVVQKTERRVYIIGFNQKLRKWSDYDRGLLSLLAKEIDIILG